MKKYFVLSALLLALSVSAFSQTCQYHFEVRSLIPWNGYYWNQSNYTWGGEDTILTFENIDPSDSIRLEYDCNQGCPFPWGRASLYKDGVKIDTSSLWPLPWQYGIHESGHYVFNVQSLPTQRSKFYINVSFLPTSIVPIIDNSTLSAYYNGSGLTFQSSKPFTGQIQIYDVLGQELATFNTSIDGVSSWHSPELPILPSGIYFWTARNEQNELSSSKFFHP